ncbi:MAG: hypothetical protein NW216_00750 [Hyphomicrobium sp.]|nr:hypothetical protein [Hyphomicrobium sp.]
MSERSFKLEIAISLLALAACSGGRLVTLDRSVSLAAVRGVSPENLASIF